MQTNSLRNLHIIIFTDLSLTFFVVVNFVIIRKIQLWLGYGCGNWKIQIEKEFTIY